MHSPSPLGLLLALTLLPSSTLLAIPPGQLGSLELCDCSAPDFWVVNSRCAPRCSNLDAGFETLTYQQWCPAQETFIARTRDEFLAAQASVPTLLFSHGNTLEHKGALQSAWIVYNRIKSCPGPKLLVLWSWPAEILYVRPIITPVKTARKNIRTKYVYAEHQGYYIAKLTNMMSTAHPVTLSGHSFGGVSVLCALHYLGGGELQNRVLEGGAPFERPNLRCCIISGACDNDHLYPSHRYSQAFVAVERLQTTFSDRDATLRRWPNLSFRGQEAMGYTGICAARLGENSHKLVQQRLTEDVGRSHYMTPHFASYRMLSMLCQTAFNTCPAVCGGSGSKLTPLPKNAESFDPRQMIQIPARTAFPALGL